MAATGLLQLCATGPRAFFGLFWLVLLPIAVGATNGFLNIGYGAKAIGLGGAQIAYPQDSFSPVANPASGAMLCQRIDGGFVWLKHSGHLRVTQVNADGTTTETGGTTRRPMWWPEAGILVRPSACYALGFAAYAAGGWRVNFHEPIAPYGTSPLRSHFLPYLFTTSWSMRLNPCHCIGAAINVVYGHFEIAGLETVGLLSKRDATRVGAGVRVGWIGRLTPALLLGLTYQTRTWTTRSSRFATTLSPPFDLPPQLGFGIGWLASCRTQVAFDAVRIFWRQVTGYSREFTDMRPGLGWNDQLVLKLGIAWRFRRSVILRIGYNHANTVLPGSQGFINAINMDGIENHLTLGGTLLGGRAGELSIAYVHAFRKSVAGFSPSVFNTNLVSRQNAFIIEYGRRF